MDQSRESGTLDRATSELTCAHSAPCNLTGWSWFGLNLGCGIRVRIRTGDEGRGVSGRVRVRVHVRIGVTVRIGDRVAVGVAPAAQRAGCAGTRGANLSKVEARAWCQGMRSRLQLGGQVAQEPGVRLDALQVQPVRRVDHEDALQEVPDLL